MRVDQAVIEAYISCCVTVYLFLLVFLFVSGLQGHQLERGVVGL